MINQYLHNSRIFFLSLFLLLSGFVFSQDTSIRRLDTTTTTMDTLPVTKDTTKRMFPVDSIQKVATPLSRAAKADSMLRHHSAKTAALRSAILPGWGQIYNKKYWKLPIVYGALGIAGAVFAYNLTNYRDLRVAYRAKYKASNGDSSELFKVRDDLAPISMNALRSYRDEFRKNIDYSALFFILMWGLNVVDATVDAHLKPFDVSPDLSLRFKLGPSQMARTTGVSLILAFNSGKRQTGNGNWRGF